MPENTNDITAIFQQGVLVIGAEADTKTATQGITITLRDATVQRQPYVLISDFDRGTKFNDAAYDTSQNIYTKICEYEYEDLLEGTPHHYLF